MIFGIGTDIVDIKRIEKILNRFGSRFKERVFTEGEISYIETKSNPALGYATRFAAKEACAKALGSGFRDGISFIDFEIVHNPNGKPVLVFHNQAQSLLRSQIPDNFIYKLDVSLSDDYPMAIAFVVISTLLKPVES